MEKLLVDVFYDKNRFGYDCTNGGVTSRHTKVTLFFDCSKESAKKHCQENGISFDSALWLNRRILWDEEMPIAVPLEYPKGKVGPMFGGNFIYTSDSRFPCVGRQLKLPIPVHDRFETQQEYDVLSR